MIDAYEQLHELLQTYTKQWEIRTDLVVKALATERTVEFSLGHCADSGKPYWTFESTRRNVRTMRELANVLLAACDFVEASNPTWASGMPGDPPEKFEVGPDDYLTSTKINSRTRFGGGLPEGVLAGESGGSTGNKGERPAPQ